MDLSFLGGSAAKNPPANAGDSGSILGVGKVPRRRQWQPTLVFLPGESYGQRSPVGYSPGGHRELDMTGILTHSMHVYKKESWSLLLNPPKGP